MDRCLTFDDLQPYAEAAQTPALTEDLQAALDAREKAFMMDLDHPGFEPRAVVRFRAIRLPLPKVSHPDAYPRGILAEVSDLWGTIGQNLSNIEGTAPDEYLCDAEVRIL